ncbi:MAG: elongation factor P [SAR324 cluster bacterium]|nr:elongation factor P [SAR324 cluster bacterium]
MHETNSFKKGLRVEIDSVPYMMLEVEFVRPGKGQAFTRVKMRNMLTGNVLSRTFKSGEKLPPADIIELDMQFLYNTNDVYHFMDNKSYEQHEITKEKLSDSSWRWLTDGMQTAVTLFNGRPIAIALPNFSVLVVEHCEPGGKGDTVTNATKPATLQTSAVIQVPLFVKEGDKVRVDTRTGLYVDRIK